MVRKRPNKKPSEIKGTGPTKKDMRKKLMIQAMKNSLGNVTAACQEVGIGRDTYYQWYNQDPVFRKALEEISENCLDFYEGKLHELVDSLNPGAVMFALKCKGKKRGWVERQEIVNTEQISSDDIDLSKLSDSELDKFLEIVKKCKKKD